jgi:hypothetical protein
MKVSVFFNFIEIKKYNKYHSYMSISQSDYSIMPIIVKFIRVFKNIISIKSVIYHDKLPITYEYKMLDKQPKITTPFCLTKN